MRVKITKAFIDRLRNTGDTVDFLRRFTRNHPERMLWEYFSLKPGKGALKKEMVMAELFSPQSIVNIRIFYTRRRSNSFLKFSLTCDEKEGLQQRHQICSSWERTRDIGSSTPGWGRALEFFEECVRNSTPVDLES